MRNPSTCECKGVKGIYCGNNADLGHFGETTETIETKRYINMIMTQQH